MKQNLLDKMMNSNKINNIAKQNYGYVFGNDEQPYKIGYHE